MWYLSIGSSAIFVGGTVTIWSFAVTATPSRPAQELILLDESAAEASLAAYLERTTPSVEPVRIPTGVFGQSVRFTGANNILLTGYIWQTVEDGPNSAPPPGVIMPEAEEIAIRKDYTSADGTTTGWYFETTLRQPFDYAKYPFDREDVWIRMWPGDRRRFGPDVVLMPDFSSYHERRPSEAPGLERPLVLEGWDIKNSYFSYRENSYNVNFGLESGQDTLELYFNIGLSRQFLSPFISDMVPLNIVAFLLFAVLMIATREDSKIGLLGYSTSAVLGYCAALFFVLIVGHVHLRETLASQGIIYLEYFYFVMYFAILAVSANSLLFTSTLDIPVIRYRDNNVIKQLYWPLLTGTLFIITIVAFR